MDWKLQTVLVKPSLQTSAILYIHFFYLFSQEKFPIIKSVLINYHISRRNSGTLATFTKNKLPSHFRVTLFVSHIFHLGILSLPQILYLSKSYYSSAKHQFCKKSPLVSLRILTGKKHRQIKLQRLKKVRIWEFGLLVQQINSL